MIKRRRNKILSMTGAAAVPAAVPRDGGRDDRRACHAEGHILRRLIAAPFRLARMTHPPPMPRLRDVPYPDNQRRPAAVPAAVPRDGVLDGRRTCHADDCILCRWIQVMNSMIPLWRTTKTTGLTTIATPMTKATARRRTASQGRGRPAVRRPSSHGARRSRRSATHARPAEHCTGLPHLCDPPGTDATPPRNALAHQPTPSSGRPGGRPAGRRPGRPPHLSC